LSWLGARGTPRGTPDAGPRRTAWYCLGRRRPERTDAPRTSEREGPSKTELSHPRSAGRTVIAAITGRSKAAASIDRCTFVCGHSAIAGRPSVRERLLVPGVTDGPRPKGVVRCTDLATSKLPPHTGTEAPTSPGVRYRRAASRIGLAGVRLAMLLRPCKSIPHPPTAARHRGDGA